MCENTTRRQLAQHAILKNVRLQHHHGCLPTNPKHLCHPSRIYSISHSPANCNTHTYTHSATIHLHQCQVRSENSDPMRKMIDAASSGLAACTTRIRRAAGVAESQNPSTANKPTNQHNNTTTKQRNQYTNPTTNIITATNDDDNAPPQPKKERKKESTPRRTTDVARTTARIISWPFICCSGGWSLVASR